MADEEGECDSKKQEEERAPELFHWACHHPIGIFGTSLVQVDIWLFKQRAQCFLSGLFVGCAVVEQRTTVVRGVISSSKMGFKIMPKR